MLKEILRLLIVLPVALIALVLALPVILIAVPFWLVAIAVRHLPRFWEPTTVEWNELLAFDPDLGWKPKPNMNAHYAIERDDIYRLETDEEGWPNPDNSIEESDVVVFGDSYAFGFGIDPEESYMHVNPVPKVKAIGAPGYNMVQELLLMKQLSDRLRGKLVVWFVYPENDFPENLRPAISKGRCPFLRKKNRDDSWEIVTDHLSPRTWRSSSHQDNKLNLAKLCTKGPFSERVYSACRFLLAQGKDVVSSAGAKLMVLTIPYSGQLTPSGTQSLRSHLSDDSTFDPEYPDKTIAAICNELQIPFVAAAQVLNRDDYKRFEEYHWTATGHQKIGELIREAYTSHQSGDLPPPSPGMPRTDAVQDPFPELQHRHGTTRA